MVKIDAFGLEITRRAEEMRTHTPQFARQRSKKGGSCRGKRGELPKERMDWRTKAKDKDQRSCRASEEDAESCRKGERLSKRRASEETEGTEARRGDRTETKGDRERRV